MPLSCWALPHPALKRITPATRIPRTTHLEVFRTALAYITPPTTMQFVPDRGKFWKRAHRTRLYPGGKAHETQKMSREQPVAILDPLRRLINRQTGSSLSDAQLLDN